MQDEIRSQAFLGRHYLESSARRKVFILKLDIIN
jgi:hypothetical protein